MMSRPGQPAKYGAGRQAGDVALARSHPPEGAARRTIRLSSISARHRPKIDGINRESIRQIPKNACKPWRKVMWRIGRITAECRERMCDVPGLHAKPCNADEPVICVDEKSNRLLEQTRRPLPAAPGKIAGEDCEHKRAGTRNLFAAVEPNAGNREAAVTGRRTKPDFAAFVQFPALEVYGRARKIHPVPDGLNAHFRASFEAVMGLKAAAAFLSRLEFHHTPKHAIWLNMAEIETGVLDRRCAGRRIGQETLLRSEDAHAVLVRDTRRNVLLPALGPWQSPGGSGLRRAGGFATVAAMLRLTKHEQLVLCAVFGLLLVGLAVKTWRLRQPAVIPELPAASASAIVPAAEE